MTLKSGRPPVEATRSGAFMGEAPWQSQPIRAANIDVQSATIEMPRRSSLLVKHDLFGKTGSHFFRIMPWVTQIAIIRNP